MLKYCAVFSLWAGLGLAGDFITGQAARLVIAQTTFTSQSFGVSNTLMGSAAGLAFANDTLFVVDGNRLGFQPINNRVLMFTNMSQELPQPTASIPVFSGRCPVCGGQASVVLGQPNFTTSAPTRTQTGMNLPLAVASDGQILAVADTANNRVLIWKSIPANIGQPADIVLGQTDFNTLGPVVVTASTFRAPQGVWIQNGKMFIADTQNNRVLIWNSIPTKNNQPADLVIGSPNFTTVPQQDLTKSSLTAAPNTLLTPITVTTDGTHMFVSDLGFNRVLIWNSIPTQNGQAADVVIGQKDFVTAVTNDSSDLCVSNGTDSNNNPTYPTRCGKTLNFPRFALSDGQRLYIADGGNDRVLVYNTIPTQSSIAADVILGQPDEFLDVVTSTNDTFDPNLAQSASNTTPTPTALAWDGTNLYVADPSNFRVLVFTPSDPSVPADGVRNAASVEIFALGSVTIGGTITADNTVTITINGTAYTYKIVKDDTFDTILTALANLINAGSGDPNVLAKAQLGFQTLQLVARAAGDAGNSVTLTATVSTSATITATASGATLSGGKSASTIAPGTLVTILGTNLSDSIAAAPSDAAALPFELGGVQVYFDGIRAPLMYVSPTQINAQVPFEMVDTNSSSSFVRTQRKDGSVTVTSAVGVPIATQNPGIFADYGTDPRPAIAYHESSYANGVVSVDGSIAAGDIATVTIEDRTYNYNVQFADTLATIRDGLIAAINANTEEKVVAFPAAAFTRIRLRAKAPGPDGNGIPIAGTSTTSGTASGSVTLGGTITAGDSVTVTIGGTGYTYTIVAGDTFDTILTGLANAINANSGNSNATAQPRLGSQMLGIVARTAGTTGNSITLAASVSSKAVISATASGSTLSGGNTAGAAGSVIITATSSALCCANKAGARITPDNPAVPGETIYLFSTGMGLVTPDEAKNAIIDGAIYQGPPLNDPVSSVSSLVGGRSATVLSAGLKVGAIGIYQVTLQLDSQLITNPATQLTVSQDIYTSNIVTIPVVSPAPPSQ